MARQDPICSPANPSPKAIRTRSATAFPTKSSTPSSRERRKPASTRGNRASPARRWPPPTASSSPARRAGPRTITHGNRSKNVARAAIKDIGYEQDGFHWKTAEVEVLLHAQSADIAQGVDAAGNKDEGAGDQGIMFGYACRETPELMPAPIYYATRSSSCMADARHSGESHGARARRQEPGDRALRERQAGRRDRRSWSRPSTSTRR